MLGQKYFSGDKLDIRCTRNKGQSLSGLRRCASEGPTRWHGGSSHYRLHLLPLASRVTAPETNEPQDEAGVAPLQDILVQTRELSLPQSQKSQVQTGPPGANEPKSQARPTLSTIFGCTERYSSQMNSCSSCLVFTSVWKLPTQKCLNGEIQA